MVPNGTFREVSVSSSSQFPTLFPFGADFGCLPLMGEDLGESSIDVSFGSAICSDVTDASTAETFCQFYPSLLLCLCLVRDEI